MQPLRFSCRFYKVTAGILASCPALIEQGINDMTFLALSAMMGNFSWENYVRYKRVALATGALILAGAGVAKWVLGTAEKLAEKTTGVLNSIAQKVNSPLPKAVISTTAEVVQKGSTLLPFAQKVVGSVHTPQLGGQTKLSFVSQVNGALKQVVKQTATQATMQYLTTTFCPDDLEKNVRKTIGARFHVQVEEIAQEIKTICIKIFEYSESPEQAEKIVQFLFETSLREHIHKKHNPMTVNTSLFSTKEMGNVFANGVTGWTGKGFLGRHDRVCRR